MFFSESTKLIELALQKIDVDLLEVYLAETNWRLFKTSDSGVKIWDTIKDGSVVRLRLPGDKDFDDYARSMQMALQTLAELENRSLESLIEVLQSNKTGDIIKLTTYDRLDRSSFSIPLLDGVALIEKAKRLTTAAALSAENFKKSFSNFRSPKVLEYLSRVRLGQTESGSYRIKLLTPLPYQNLIPGIVPYERRVSDTLISGLDALDHISKSIIRTGNYQFEEYLEAVDSGVSANLCEALIDSKVKDEHLPLEIGVEYSPIIKAPHQESKSVEFNPDVLHYVEQAAKDFREFAPQVIRLTGLVTTLTNNPRKGNRLPRISLATTIEGKPRVVHITFNNLEDYLTAVDAHRAEHVLGISGILGQQGRSIFLDEPHELVAHRQ